MWTCCSIHTYFSFILNNTCNSGLEVIAELEKFQKTAKDNQEYGTAFSPENLSRLGLYRLKKKHLRGKWENSTKSEVLWRKFIRIDWCSPKKRTGDTKTGDWLQLRERPFQIKEAVTHTTSGLGTVLLATRCCRVDTLTGFPGGISKVHRRAISRVIKKINRNCRCLMKSWSGKWLDARRMFLRSIFTLLLCSSLGSHFWPLKRGHWARWIDQTDTLWPFFLS